MPEYTPRGIQFIRAAIAEVGDLGELARLRALAREQWGDDPAHERLEAVLDQRAAELEGRPGGAAPAGPRRRPGDLRRDGP